MTQNFPFVKKSRGNDGLDSISMHKNRVTESAAGTKTLSVMLNSEYGGTVENRQKTQGGILVSETDHTLGEFRDAHTADALHTKSVVLERIPKQTKKRHQRVKRRKDQSVPRPTKNTEALQFGNTSLSKLPPTI